MTGSPRRPSYRTSGFTLVELLVVLAILGALAGVAIRSVRGLQDSARYDATVRALEEARTAILGGRDRFGDYSPGFLSDVGRLPADPAGGASLVELVQLPIGIAPSSLLRDAVDGEVVVAVGWRGPYLNLAPGVGLPRDGWGNDLILEQIGSGARIVSLGADGVAGGMQYDRDFEVILAGTTQNLDLTTATLAGTVTVHTPPRGSDTQSWTVHVYLYAPNPATGGLQAIEEEDDMEVEMDGEAPKTFRFAFPASKNIAPGVRTLRAYAHLETTAPRDESNPRSAPVTLVLPHGASMRDLEIR